MDRREGVALALATTLGLLISVLEYCLTTSAHFDRPALMRALFGGGARALTVALVHIVVGRTFLLPFAPNVVPRPPRSKLPPPPPKVDTLVRHPGAAAACLVVLAGGTHLFVGVPGYASLGAVVMAVTPFLAALLLAGARVAKLDAIVLAVTIPILFVSSTLARDGQLMEWTMAGVNKQLPGLQADTIARDVLSALATTFLLHLVAHVHVLLLLSPSLPPTPPANLVGHITLLARVVAIPPMTDTRVLLALREAPPLPPPLRLAALAVPRELRIALTAVYWWYATTAAFARDIPAIDDYETMHRARVGTSFFIRYHLIGCWDQWTALDKANLLHQGSVDPAQQAPYYLLGAIVPRLAPAWPFFEIVNGLKEDLRFLPVPLLTQRDDLKKHMSIDTPSHLEKYVSAIGGASAAIACYLAWSLLEDHSSSPLTPAAAHSWSKAEHPFTGLPIPEWPAGMPVRTLLRADTIRKARIMGRGMLLVSIAASASADCARGRVYLPLSTFKGADELADALHGRGVPWHTLVPVLRMAESAREEAENSIKSLPKPVRAAARAAVAATYVPACCLWNGAGETDKPCTCSLNRAALRAIWG
ncbi:uncharacterized protein COLE_03744 [Cutaneotrichosporon oleaginosum]|nr:hypothetical protein COLE_03744 [Cutaneotrichosporon oleaginosum]